jgi:hypothetical protein
MCALGNNPVNSETPRENARPFSLRTPPLEDVRIPEFDLTGSEIRNLFFDQRQQLLAARIILVLEQERSVLFQLSEFPPNAEFLKHLAASWVGYACDDAWQDNLAPLAAAQIRGVSFAGLG